LADGSVDIVATPRQHCSMQYTPDTVKLKAARCVPLG
jgi:hypothetical protein